MPLQNLQRRQPRTKTAIYAALVTLGCTATIAQAHEYLALDEAYKSIPSSSIVSQIENYAPVFDITDDSCLPAAGISRSGAQNGGLDDSGTIVGDCRSNIPNGFTGWANTYHRWVRQFDNGNEYTAHVYELYFEKDMAFNGISDPGHRHDVETVVMYFTNGTPTHVAVSAHGDYTRKSWSAADKEGTHPKVVYFKTAFTHSFAFLDELELVLQFPFGYSVQNPDGVWVQPAIVSWYEMHGDGVDNATMRNSFNTWSFGDAAFKFKDARFIDTVNHSDALPSGYPTFTQAQADLAEFGDLPALNGTLSPLLLED